MRKRVFRAKRCGKRFPHPASFAVVSEALQRPILERMVRRFHNWSYRDVIRFLKENEFSFYKELGGSHEAWIKRRDDGEPDRIVEVNFTHRSYPVKTLKTMIRQSGIDQNEWVNWRNS